MAEKTNRRDFMIDTARRLFVQQGYNATSVRQIAEAVGCTEAALYYHFREGKRELLAAVIESHLPDLMSTLEGSEEAGSLYDLLHTFGSRVVRLAPIRLQYLRWIVSEFPLLSEEERAFLHRGLLGLQKGLREHIQRFLPDPTGADMLAWIVLCAVFGYGNAFINLDLQSKVNFSSDTFVEQLAATLATGAEGLCYARDGDD